MANDFSEVKPLLFAQGLQTLREACVMPRLVNTDFADTPAGQGDTVNVTVPLATSDEAVTASHTPYEAAAAGSKKVPIELSQWRHAGFAITDKERGEIFAGVVPGILTERIRALANRVNWYILSKYVKVYGYAGTAGTTPFGETPPEFTAAAQVGKVLNRQLAPLDDRRLILDPEAEAKAVVLLANAALVGSNQTVVSGSMGRRVGFDWVMDQQVPYHTSGTITTGLIAKASTAVAAGVKSFLATTAASTGAAALKIGDVISIGGHTTTYVLTAAATQASASSDVTLAIEPGLEQALVGSEAITVKASHRVNLAFQKNGIAFASRRLTSMATENIMSMADPVSGLTLRMEISRQNKQDLVDFDILYGAEVVRPELVARLAG